MTDRLASGAKFINSIRMLVKDRKTVINLAIIICLISVLLLVAHFTGVLNIRVFKNSDPSFTKEEVIQIFDSLESAHKKEIAYVIDSVNKNGGCNIIRDIKDKQSLVQPLIDKIRDDHNVDLVEIYLFHDGQVTLSRLHFLKATQFFYSKNPEYPSNNFRSNIPLYPYVDESLQILKTGYIYIDDTRSMEHKTKAAYILSRMAYNENTRTFLLVPIISKDGSSPVGCVTLNYQNKPRKISQKEISHLIEEVNNLATFVVM